MSIETRIEKNDRLSQDRKREPNISLLKYNIKLKTKWMKTEALLTVFVRNLSTLMFRKVEEKATKIESWINDE